MKKSVTTLTLALFCASSFSTTPCTASEVVRESRETESFRKINASGGIDVYFTQNETYSIVVEADEEYVGNIATEVDNETLSVKWRKNIRDRSIKKVAKVHVSAPALYMVSASAVADFYADKLQCDASFQLRSSGGADVNIAALTADGNADISTSSGADVDITSLTVAGSANISASGGADVTINSLTVAESANISASGGADVDINSLTVAGSANISTSGADCDVKNLQTVHCTLTSSGGGDMNITVNASGNLSAKAVGGGDIKVTGAVGDVVVVASGGAYVDLRRLTYKNIDIQKSGGGDVYR
ncbi:MAG: DUF2807 domain-containing protein [Prevotellaceae bacterium]|jgi:hypothetical protein|nr:DUF2807 domain-containing protein [Prevotellaceae bacterium]